MHSNDDLCVAAGIPSGLVRMSVGITGTLEQRWEQLRQSYLAATAGIAPAGQPALQGTNPAAKVPVQMVVNVSMTTQPMPEELPSTLP